MDVQATELEEVRVVIPRVMRDPRGYFFESWRAPLYAAAGIEGEFVQDNVSYSCEGVLRGLHFQHPHGQGKLVTVLHGEIFDVAVDIRTGSATYGRWIGRSLSATNAHQLFIPPGFAHGFLVTSADAIVAYKCTETYHPESETTIRWDDPDIAVAWPLAHPVLSDRDRAGMFLRDIPPERLPRLAPPPVDRPLSHPT